MGCDITVPNLTVHKNNFRTKEEKSTGKQLSPLNGTFNDFVIGRNVSAMENETLELQTTGHENDFQRTVDSASQNQIIGIDIDDKDRKTVDNALMTVENCMHDANLTAMDKMAIPRIEMAVSLITVSSGHGLNIVVQKPDWRKFTRNTKNTLLMSASST